MKHTLTSFLMCFWVLVGFTHRVSTCVQMSAVGITENVKGDSKKFEVWYNGREEVYIIQVRLLVTFSMPPRYHASFTQVTFLLPVTHSSLEVRS